MYSGSVWGDTFSVIRCFIHAGCLVGEVATEFSDGQRLTDNGGTYLMQPQQMCSGCLAYLETCFFYSHTNSQNAPIFFSMQVGVFRKNDTLRSINSKTLCNPFLLFSIMMKNVHSKKELSY